MLTPTLEKNYQGYALKINPNDGAVLASGVNTQTTSISKFTGVYLAKDENNQQTIHAFGYDMGPGAIDFVLEENAATKTLANTGHSVVMNSVSVATTPVAFDGRVVFFNRFGQALTAGFKATYMDGTETTPVNCWSAAVYSYTGNGIISTGEPFGDVPTKIKDNNDFDAGRVESSNFYVQQCRFDLRCLLGIVGTFHESAAPPDDQLVTHLSDTGNALYRSSDVLTDIFVVSLACEQDLPL